MSGELSATTSTTADQRVAFRNRRELGREVLDVVVDGLEAVSTGFDEELVERHVERPSG